MTIGIFCNSSWYWTGVRVATLSRCKAYTTLDTSNLPTLNLHYSVWTHIITYSGKYPALPWLPILHPASPYPTIVYTMLPKHIPSCLNLKLSSSCVWFKSGWNVLPQGPKWHSRKRFRLSRPKRPVSVFLLPNENDFDDVISKHTHCDVSIDLVTGKTHTEFILTLKQVV